jgi:hypothetical protein
MPKVADDRRRKQPSQDLWQKGKMVVLDEHETTLLSGLFDDSLGKSLVHPNVFLPSILMELRPVINDVAQGPNALVAATIIEPILLLTVQPDPAQGIGPRVRRDSQTAAGVRGLTISRASSVSNPGTSRLLKDRIQNRNEAAVGLGAMVSLRRQLVNIGFVISDYDQATIPQPSPKVATHSLSCPHGGASPVQELPIMPARLG